jgi:hypothetical protein
LIACVALRTNLTIRVLTVVTRLSKSAVHRTVAALTPQIAALGVAAPTDYRESWILDGSLIPTRDRTHAAKSKNDRWSCNAQVLVRQRDPHVIETAAGGAGNRNDPIHYRGSSIEALCTSHRRVLADGGYRGVDELVTPLFCGNRILNDRAWRRHRRRRARVEHALAPQEGGCFVTTGGAGVISTRHCERSRRFTISHSRNGTTLSSKQDWNQFEPDPEPEPECTNIAVLSKEPGVTMREVARKHRSPT